MTTTNPAEPTNELLEAIRARLAEPGGAVVVATWARATYYTKPAHAALFSARDGEAGVYVRRGKARDYVMPEYVKFGRMK